MASHYVCSKSQLAAYISVFKKVQPNWELLLKWYVLLMHDHACKIHSWVLEHKLVTNLDPLIPKYPWPIYSGQGSMEETPTWKAWAYFLMARESTGLCMFALFMINDALGDVGGSGLLSSASQGCRGGTLAL